MSTLQMVPLDMVEITMDEYVKLQTEDRTSQMRQARKMWMYLRMYSAEGSSRYLIPKGLLPEDFVPSKK